MTRFQDGPAAGVTLMLRRSPLFLRVVLDPAGKFDALDQLTDTPAAGEAVTVYRKVSDDGGVHIDYTEKGRRKGAWYSCATYALVEDQPGDEVTRDTAAWRAWCVEQQKGGAR